MKYMFGLPLIFYVAVRALSFFLINIPFAQELIAAVLVGTFLYYCIKNISFAWQLLVVEILIDGAGHFFELQSLLLRTWLLGIFAIVWIYHKIRMRSAIALPHKNTLIALGVFGIFFLWSVLNGFLRDNATMFVVQDAILYLFILLLFPALEFENKWQTLYANATKVFIFGTTIFSAITLALYSSGIFKLTDSYYHWFRNVASGKITDLGLNFFRIVLSEQILFVPIILVIFSCLLKKVADKKLWILFACSLFVIILNFTRIYFLALMIGAVLLLYRESWKQWIKVSALTIAASAAIFCSVFFVASRGESIGLEQLGVRASGFKAPQTDVSGAIRMAMLPDIYKTITARPLLGSGLGTTVSYIDPATQTPQTRTQFDWGYFEMVTELGIIGTLTYLTLLGVIIWNFARTVGLDSPLARGLIAGAVSLFIINITTPALFQGFGVIYFASLVAMTVRTEIIKKENQ